MTQAVLQGLPPDQLLLQQLMSLGIPYGRESSFKLLPGVVYADRLLIGIKTQYVDPKSCYEIARTLGMPLAAQQVLQPYQALASSVFYAVERQDEDWICKCYFEFWEQALGLLKQGREQAILMHLGVKWRVMNPEKFEQAHYIWHPKLSSKHILRQLAQAYPESASSLACISQQIVRQGLKRNQNSPMMYLTVSELNNPRQSFDINLYNSGLSLADVRQPLWLAGESLQVDHDVLAAQLDMLAACRLGHISGGISRDEREFLTVYCETI